MQKPVEQRPENSIELGSLESLRFDNVVFRHRTARSTDARSGVQGKSSSRRALEASKKGVRWT